jgi:ADP-dependent NAD(P)H-hydrate dehydratase / NAD(P)H-hydrate epimerase
MTVLRVLPTKLEWPLFNAVHTQRIEVRERATLAPHTLMARAGDAVARLALALAPHAQRVWVAAGPGNNGGDGLAAAALLCQSGRQVAATLFGDTRALPDDARKALARAQAAGVRIIGTNDGPFDTAALGAQDLAIDALLGIGASRPAQGFIAGAIHQLNTLACPVLAVDLPSGLNAGTGQALGEDCVRAARTLSLLTLKPGLFTAAGRDHAGEVWFDALGTSTSDDIPDAWLSAGSPAAVAHRARRHAQHKGSFGDLCVIGGAPGMTGAALLAARAAHASGAGRVFVEWVGLEAGAPAFDPLRPELMFRAAWSRGPAETIANATVVCGCGGGDAVRAALPRVLSVAGRLVLDADALNAVATDPALVALLRARARHRASTIMTPHPLEAARLLGTTTAQVQADRLLAARELAGRFECVVVLKGSGSVVAAPGQTPRINATGNASLASAGTGDVLAGWLGGLWAQVASGDAADAAFALAVQAVAEHGAAAHSASQGPMRASDLIETMHSQLG